MYNHSSEVLSGLLLVRFFGGTTFGRWVGGPGIITSYDYDVALNEYGLPNPAKFNQSRTLHYWLRNYEPFLMAADTIPPTVSLGPQQEATAYTATPEGDQDAEVVLKGVIFLANIADAIATVTWPPGSATTFTLPAWSVSIVDATSLQVQFNTATGPYLGEFMTAQQNAADFEEHLIVHRPPKVVKQRVQPPFPVSGGGDDAFQCWADEFGIWNETAVITSQRPLEQTSVTLDETDYLFYATHVTLTDSMLAAGQISIEITMFKDYAMIGVTQETKSGVVLISTTALNSSVSFWPSSVIISDLTSSAGWTAGPAQLIVLSQALGMQNFGPFLELLENGFANNATIAFDGEAMEQNGWQHLPGLSGESLQVPTWLSDSPQWSPRSECTTYASQNLVWFRLQISINLTSDPTGVYAIDLGSMSKGALWVNGHHLGRYWLLTAVDSVNDCAPCMYARSYDENNCRTGCGEPSQQYYHVPRSWLSEGVNQVTLLEEHPLVNPRAPSQVTIVRMNDWQR